MRRTYTRVARTTRFARFVPFLNLLSEKRAMSFARHEASDDPAEVVARVAASRRARLLRVHRHRLRFEDLEDCYSQATLELLVRSRRSPFADDEHALHALEQKFLSRIADRRRALAGRSGIEAAIANAVPVDCPGTDHPELEDRRSGIERQVMIHSEVRRLREVIADLTLDQRLALHGQVNLGLDAEAFCERYGWSIDKFRKVTQRARWRLRALVDEYQSGGRCRRLEADLLALVAKSASAAQDTRARLHLTNCAPCARHVARLERAERDIAVVLPPLAIAGRLGAHFMAGLTHLKRVLLALRHPFSEAGVAGIAGGSSAGLATVKAGVLALCIASAAGGYALCEHARVPLLFGGAKQATHHRRHGAAPATARVPISRVPRVVSSRVVNAHVRHAGRHAVLEQIRREFGAHHVVAASVTSTRPALSLQTSATIKQEQTEFGFER